MKGNCYCLFSFYGNKIQTDIPTQIGTDTDLKKIDARLTNSFAIKNNGTL